MQKVAEIIGRVNTQLVDVAWLRWPKAELLDYYNDAIRAVIIVRPGAGERSELLTCVEGTKQQLPVGANRLLDITRVAGGRVIRPVPREALDTQFPDWHFSTGTIEGYCYDEQTPRTYYVFPGAAAGVQLDAVVSRIPEAVTLAALDEALVTLDELYTNPLIEWMLYRCYSKDSQNGANSQLALQHYQAFNDQLGVKTQAEMAAGNKKREQYNGSTQV
ncbi:Uncharacterised protein [Serratia quinivorans]|uniref:phage adaptor protein n=1 Tax=Serratia quinivorans TaxID=137545 RepID=UPI002179DF4E|nr:DUF6682 family protein [Serratia quinivorans]CAI0848226.1 Uncharacterised protein [Serratia quinivorans]CAI0888831.1 Uncharacterised protein [Serratia quinivorans]CAI1679490.1 Uncharacterised protein [Serratia quinivorans]CAI2080134.1 Uncharacterised protein [Serratia quinivorans]CAI2439116.1 Uncharacterised protein [Serratia quinivorans]